MVGRELLVETSQYIGCGLAEGDACFTDAFCQAYCLAPHSEWVAPHSEWATGGTLKNTTRKCGTQPGQGQGRQIPDGVRCEDDTDGEFDCRGCTNPATVWPMKDDDGRSRIKRCGTERVPDGFLCSHSERSQDSCQCCGATAWYSLPGVTYKETGNAYCDTAQSLGCRRFRCGTEPKLEDGSLCTNDNGADSCKRCKTQPQSGSSASKCGEMHRTTVAPAATAATTMAAEEGLAAACAKPVDQKCQSLKAEKCEDNVEYAKLCPKMCGKCPEATQPPTVAANATKLATNITNTPPTTASVPASTTSTEHVGGQHSTASGTQSGPAVVSTRTNDPAPTNSSEQNSDPENDDPFTTTIISLAVAILLCACCIGGFVWWRSRVPSNMHGQGPRPPNPPTYVNPTFPPPRTAPNTGEGIQPATTPVPSNTGHLHGQSATINPATPNSDDQVLGEGGREPSANANEYNHLHGQIEPHVYSTPSNYDVLQRQEGKAVAGPNEYNRLDGKTEPHVYSTPHNYDQLQRQEGTAATFDCCTTPRTSCPARSWVVWLQFRLCSNVGTSMRVVMLGVAVLAYTLRHVHVTCVPP